MRLNFQGIVTQFFEWQSSIVVRWPLPFIVVPVVLTASLVGIVVSDFHLNIGNDTLQVFLPDEMESLTDLKELMRLFPPRDAQRDSYSIFGSKFAYTVMESNDENILTTEGIDKLTRLHRFVSGLKSSQGERHASVCLKAADDDACTMHPIAFALEDDTPKLSIQFLLRYPMLKLGDFVIDNAIVFGGVTLKPKPDGSGNSPISSVKAVRIAYVLDTSERAERWLDAFLSEMPKYKEENVTVLWSSSKSLAKEMERNGELLIPWMPWTSIVLIVFCMLVCSSLDPVKAQPWIGFFAMFSASMATIASTAFLLYLQYPFIPLVFIMPFLVVSIGTDNMFLMLKSWRMTKELNSEKRYVDALTETAASLFLTSLTDGMSFSIGSISEFHAVRVFCTYCAMAILFMFVFQVTFFNAIMTLFCRREVAQRHAIFCWRTVVKDKTLSFHESAHSSSTQHSLVLLLYRVLNPWQSRIAVLFVFLLYLWLSIVYTFSLPLGLDLKLLAPDDSYAGRELMQQERLFGEYGSFCFGVIRASNFTLTDPQKRRDLVVLYRQLGSSPYASKVEFWLEAFERKYRGQELVGQKLYDRIHDFLSTEEHKKFRTDIRFSMNGDIEALKMIFRVRKLGTINDAPRAEFMRKTMAKSGFDGFVYDTSFLLVDQQMVTVFNVLINVVSAIVTMLVICVLMVPRPVSAMCIALAILSVNIGVVGALSAVQTRLDIISMITIVMSIGFSVDYVTHTTFHYVTQKGDRLKRCLMTMTEPILQSALSTAVGVCLLAFVPSYIVRTFVFTVLFVVLIGIAHGIVFLPVLLDTVVPLSEYMEPYQPHHERPSKSGPAKYPVEHVYEVPYTQASTPSCEIFRSA